MAGLVTSHHPQPTVPGWIRKCYLSLYVEPPSTSHSVTGFCQQSEKKDNITLWQEKRAGNWVASSRVPLLSPSPTPSPTSLLSCLPFTWRKHARGLSRSEKMLAHTWLDFFLSAAPSALLLLLLWASSICRTLTVLGLSCHSCVGYPAVPTCFHSFPRNPTSPWQSGSFPSVLPALASLQMLCAFSEGLTGPDAFDISSPSNISKFRYCALVKEVWHANVSCLRYGTRNQENWLLS